jgi:hypothetical protein
VSDQLNRRRVALLGIVALATALALVAVTLPDGSVPRRPQAAAPAAAAQSPAFGSWAPTYMADTHFYTEDQAVDLARRYDLIAALPNTFRSHVAAMRAANPGLVLLVYTNGMLSPPHQLDRLPDSWFAKDDTGRHIRSRQFGQYLMDPGQPGWRYFSTRQCAQKMQRSGSDGCLVDMLTMGVFAPRYLTSTPAGTATEPVAVQHRYLQGLVTLADQFADLPNATVAGNTVTSAARYFARPAGTRAVAAELPLNQAEDFLRAASDPADAFPDEDRWRADVAVLEDLTTLGSRSLVTTKLWVTADDDASRQWQRFSIGSFLLGAGEGSYYAFTSSRTSEGATGVDDAYRVPDRIGAPRGEMVQWQGLYAREFAGGIALVNPSSDPVAVTLPTALQSWDDEVTEDVVVPPRDATVLFGEAPLLEGTSSALTEIAPASSPSPSAPADAVPDIQQTTRTTVEATR